MKKIKNGISFSATEVELIASHQSMQIINLQPRPNGHLWSVFRNHQFMLMTIFDWYRPQRISFEPYYCKKKVVG